jgi:hypothetical protein
MKSILLFVLGTLAAGLTHAQSEFGIISYTLPQGWYARESGSDMVLERRGTENSSCSITLFQQVNSVVASEKEYAKLWALKTKTGNSKVGHTTSNIKTEEDGWISFSGAVKSGKGTPASTEGFYTLSDGNKTVMFLAQAVENKCIDEIDIILASIHIPEKGTSKKTKTKENEKKKIVKVLPLKGLKDMV